MRTQKNKQRHKKTQKNTKKRRTTQKSISDGTLGAPWARFGRSRGAHGHFLDLWGALGELLNALGALLGASWTPSGRLLDATWEKLTPSLPCAGLPIHYNKSFVNTSLRCCTTTCAINIPSTSMFRNLVQSLSLYYLSRRPCSVI